MDGDRAGSTQRPRTFGSGGHSQGAGGKVVRERHRGPRGREEQQHDGSTCMHDAPAVEPF